MEKSFSDLFAGLEKQKEVIEGYRDGWVLGQPGARGGAGALQEEGAEHSPSEPSNKARGRPASRWGLLSPASACTPGLLACHLQQDTVPSRRPCGLRGDCGPVLVAALSPPPRGRAPSPQSPGLGNGTGCSRAWCLTQVPPQCLDRAPRGRALRGGQVPGGVREAWAVCREQAGCSHAAFSTAAHEPPKSWASAQGPASIFLPETKSPEEVCRGLHREVEKEAQKQQALKAQAEEKLQQCVGRRCSVGVRMGARLQDAGSRSLGSLARLSWVPS